MGSGGSPSQCEVHKVCKVSIQEHSGKGSSMSARHALKEGQGRARHGGERPRALGPTRWQRGDSHASSQPRRVKAASGWKPVTHRCEPDYPFLTSLL